MHQWRGLVLKRSDMLKMKKLILGSLVVAAAMVSTASAHVTFYFAAKGTTTQITDLNIGSIGSTFELTVCMQIVGFTFPVSAVDAFVGFDTANSNTTSATALDGKIGLNGTIAAALTNYNANLPIRMKGLTGGETKLGSSDSSIRPYGVDVNLLADFGTEYDFGNDAVALFDISLKNLNLADGESYQLVLWDAQQGGSGTSLITNMNSDIYRPGDWAGTLNVHAPAAVPEPASMIALGIGASALVLRRRRK